jgi:restriction endonuclease S subunit
MHGNALYLQVKHFNELGELVCQLEPDLYIDEKMQKHLLQDGDILFMAKGSKNVAVIYRNLAGSAVASSSFIVVRLNSNFKTQVLPEYLAWFINHPRSQEFLKSHSKGSGIPSIALSGFAELEVSIPDLETQKNILAIHQLRIKEKTLSAEIDRLKEKYIQHQLFSGTQK